MNAWLPRTLAQWLALLVGIVALVACLLLGLWREPKQALLRICSRVSFSRV